MQPALDVLEKLSARRTSKLAGLEADSPAVLTVHRIQFISLQRSGNIARYSDAFFVSDSIQFRQIFPICYVHELSTFTDVIFIIVCPFFFSNLFIYLDLHNLILN